MQATGMFSTSAFLGLDNASRALVPSERHVPDSIWPKPRSLRASRHARNAPAHSPARSSFGQAPGALKSLPCNTGYSKHALAVTARATSPSSAAKPALQDTVERDITFARSRRDYRVVGDAVVEEVLQTLTDPASGPLKGLTPKDGKLKNAILVVQFLLQVWLSKKNVAAFIKTFPEVLSMNVSHLNTIADYFVDRACTAGEFGSAIFRQPDMLQLTLAKIEKTASYVESSGVPADKVARVLLKSPGVFDLNFERTLRPLISCLNDVVPSAGGLERVIERQPMVLELSDHDVVAVTAVMAHYGMTSDAICNLICLKPAVLLLTPEALSERFRNLQTIFSPRRLPNIFKVAPTLLCVGMEKVNKKRDIICDYLGEEVALRVINAFPQALSLSWEKVLLPKFEYLKQLALHEAEVVNFPAYLGYSLPDRIRPRCETLLREGYTIAPHNQVINSENEKKLRKNGRSHRELLTTKGEHKVCIQHIVGLLDEDFEAQFGVKLARVPRRLREMEEGDDSDLEGLEELTDEMLAEIDAVQ